MFAHSFSPAFMPTGKVSQKSQDYLAKQNKNNRITVRNQGLAACVYKL
jgi:hypothetical protein